MPMVAVMMDVAASGGYYVALAADTIVAHPTTVTGSIGVIMLSVNAEGLMQKIGVATDTIKSGERKDMGSPFRALTPEERAIFQSVIDDLHRQFVAKVVERRKLPEATAATLADGRIYTADQALGHKLVDRIGYMPDAMEAARRAAGLDEARVVVYKRPASTARPTTRERDRRRRLRGLLAARRPRRRRAEVPVPVDAVKRRAVKDARADVTLLLVCRHTRPLRQVSPRAPDHVSRLDILALPARGDESSPS